jgi:uncharacterized repeat protein (TIGR01451 family)
MTRWLKLRVFVAAGLLIAASTLFGNQAYAAVTIYGINNNAAAIQRIDPATSVATTVYSGAPFPLANRAAGLAQCPNGLLYFAQGTTGGNLYRFNPYTPSIAPVSIGSTGATTPDLIRIACHPSTGVLYAMASAPNVLYTLNTSTGAATATTLTLPVTTPPVSGSGDIGFDSGGTLYFVGEQVAGNAGSVRLYTISLATNTYSNVGAITGLPNVANGIAFDSSGNLRLSLTNQTRLYTAPISGGAASTIGANGVMPALFDLSSVDLSLDLSITKTDNVTYVTPGGNVSYVIQARNNSSVSAPITATISDTVPATVTGVTWTCTATSGSSCASTSGTGNTISTTATLAAAGVATYTVTGTVSASATVPGTLANTATVALPFGYLVDATPANNTATDSDSIINLPALTHLKTVQVTSDPVNGSTNPKNIPGAEVLYTLRVSNSGKGTVDSNSVVLTDPIPANTELFVGDLGVTGSGPIVFVDGSPTSALTWTFTSLASATDDVSFSNNGGSTYAYTPVPNASGYDPLVTNIRLNPKGTMAAYSGSGAVPSFDLRFRVRIK